MLFNKILKGENAFDLIQKFNHRHDNKTGRFASRSDSSGMRFTTVTDKETGQKVKQYHHKDLTSYSGNHASFSARIHQGDAKSAAGNRTKASNIRRDKVHMAAEAAASSISGLHAATEFKKDHGTYDTHEGKVGGYRSSERHHQMGTNPTPEQIKQANDFHAQATTHHLVSAALSAAGGKGYNMTIQTNTPPKGRSYNLGDKDSKSVSQYSSQVKLTGRGGKAAFPTQDAAHKAIQAGGLADHAVAHKDGSIKFIIPKKGTPNAANIVKAMRKFKSDHSLGSEHTHGVKRIQVRAGSAVKIARDHLAEHAPHMLEKFDAAIAHMKTQRSTKKPKAKTTA